MKDLVFNFLVTNWLDLLLAIVGLSAFGVYFWQKRDEKRTAATLVKEQIDTIEERILSLKNDSRLDNVAVYHSKVILHENMWEKYKHFLIKDLPNSDSKIIQRFFDQAEQIESVRSDLIQTLTHAWEHKSQVEHQIVGELIKLQIEHKMSNDASDKIQIEANQIDAFRQIYRPMELVFTPTISVNALVKRLNDFNVLSGTTAYSTIQSLSYDKK